MINKFKVGDTVKFVKHGCIGWENREWTKDAGLVIGKIYTVDFVGNGYASEGEIQPFVSVKEACLAVHPNHFELARSQTDRAIE